MTQEQKERLEYQIKVMQAAHEGKKIEEKPKGEVHYILKHFHSDFNWEKFDYRIAQPELAKPKTRAWTRADVEKLLSTPLWIRRDKDSNRLQIGYIEGDTLNSSQHSFTLKWLYEMRYEYYCAKSETWQNCEVVE